MKLLSAPADCTRRRIEVLKIHSPKIQTKLMSVARLPFMVNGDSLAPARFLMHMKITDDYKAKYRLWAANPRVVPASAPVRIPHFKSRRFSSHAEMNAWKSSALRQLAQAAPGK
jgi:hypothetical protein